MNGCINDHHWHEQVQPVTLFIYVTVGDVDVVALLSLLLLLLVAVAALLSLTKPSCSMMSHSSEINVHTVLYMTNAQVFNTVEKEKRSTHLLEHLR